MKKIMVLSLVILMTVGIVSAFSLPRWQEGAPRGESVTITGKIDFEDGFHVELVSGDKRYELMYPRYLTSRLGLKDNDEVTVSGTLATVPCSCDEQNGEEQHLFVSKLTVGGKEYSFGDGLGFGPMRGGRGMMGNNFPQKRGN